MKVFIFLLTFSLFCKTESIEPKPKQNEITKSLKIINIHDTKEGKILLA